MAPSTAPTMRVERRGGGRIRSAFAPATQHSRPERLKTQRGVDGRPRRATTNLEALRKTNRPRPWFRSARGEPRKICVETIKRGAWLSGPRGRTLRSVVAAGSPGATPFLAPAVFELPREPGCTGTPRARIPRRKTSRAGPDRFRWSLVGDSVRPRVGAEQPLTHPQHPTVYHRPSVRRDRSELVHGHSRSLVLGCRLKSVDKPRLRGAYPPNARNHIYSRSVKLHAGGRSIGDSEGNPWTRKGTLPFTEETRLIRHGRQHHVVAWPRLGGTRYWRCVTSALSHGPSAAAMVASGGESDRDHASTMNRRVYSRIANHVCVSAANLRLPAQ